MSTSSTIFRRALIFAITVPLLVQGAGFAHALFADHDPNRPLLEYVWIGFWHMVGGWDHLLFILGVVLIAGALKPAAKLISLFVAGHSLTLIVATVAGWKLNATFVDVVIALSLVYVGSKAWRAVLATSGSWARSCSRSASSTGSASPRAYRTSACPRT